MANISLKNIVKNYGKTEVVHSIDLEIADKEFVVLVGPSGCGKSTTLRMIAGLEDISGGDVRIGERRVNDLPPRKRNLSMVFQNYALYPHMTVRENLGFALKIANQKAATITQQVDEASSILGLTDLMDRMPGELSGGQRQRVAMGRAIVRHPDAFLFDEPLSNLDAKLRGVMRAEIKRLHQKIETTIVYVTHDQVEAMTLADRIVVMRDGYIEQIGEPIDVFNRPVNTFVASFIGSPPMNLLDATIVSGRAQMQDGTTLPIPSQLSDQIQEGQEIVYGIRPDDLSPVGYGLDESGESDVIELTVDLSEPLGMESLVYTRIAGQEILGKIYGPRVVNPGEAMSFRISLDRVHIFDAESTKRLERV